MILEWYWKLQSYRLKVHEHNDLNKVVLEVWDKDMEGDQYLDYLEVIDNNGVTVYNNDDVDKLQRKIIESSRKPVKYVAVIRLSSTSEPDKKRIYKLYTHLSTASQDYDQLVRLLGADRVEIEEI